MEINQSQQEDVTVVSLGGRFDAQSAGAADESLGSLLADGCPKLLVDLSGVEYISSAGLRVLLSTAKKQNAAGGKLVLCGLKPYVQEVFEVAGFTTIFQIMPDSAAALQSF
jgi:anti-sigma B factor antagonist